MKVLGHLTQVLHVAFVFWMTGYGWAGIGIFWCLTLLSMMLWNDCLFTIVSNWCFAQAGHPGYSGTVSWAINDKREPKPQER
jgi:hypothetical protein